MLKRAVVSRNVHKWLSLTVGLQLVVWLLSGLYMVAVDIDFIHGDPLVANMQPPVKLPEHPAVSVSELRERHPDATRITLRPVMGQAHYLVEAPSGRYRIDPETGNRTAPLDRSGAVAVARYHYNGEAPVSRVTLIDETPPMEIQRRALPLWRVDFDDRFETSFYIDPVSGQLVTRRHLYWRIFDFAWMLHIMDYEDRSDAHNPLLVAAEISGLVLLASGVWLLFYSFGGRRARQKGKS